VEAAAWCFASYGYTGTRIADIVGRAGMSQGAFYRHFADKDEVLFEVMRKPLDEMLEYAAWEPSDTLEDLVRRNTAFFRIYARHAGLTRVMREAVAVQGSAYPTLWLEQRGRFVQRILEWLESLRDLGRIDDRGDLPLLAAVLGAMLDQLAYTRISVAPVPPRPEELAAMGRITAEVWHSAVEARAPRA
jgi:AcrR family transcriptional regulator